MAVFELVLVLLLAGVLLSLAAPRLGVPWPALLALAGAALAFVPGMPAVVLDPDLALALFVAPVLLDAAFDASPRDLRANWEPVTSLVLVAVCLTVVAVAAAARWLSPGLSWAAAITLGAIVAPPDAAAASAVLRQVRLPHRMLVILEGESLLNDASALLIYRFAVGAVAGGVSVWTAPLLALSVAGGAALGFALGHVYFFLASKVQDGAPAVLLQFLGTFGVWLLADALGLSAVLTVVAYAVALAHVAPGGTRARHRRASYAVWEVVVFVLNVLAFILVGLQVRGIVTRLDGQLRLYAGFAAVILAVTVMSRIAWVMTHLIIVRLRGHRPGAVATWTEAAPTLQVGLVVSWCGMRGIVTLAAALALPGGFPQRDLFVFTAFCVVFGTLVFQGMTLGPLLAHVVLPSDESVEEEVALARREAARAALGVLAADAGTEAAKLLISEYEARSAAGTVAGLDATGLTRLRLRALVAERQCLFALRRNGRIGDDAFHRVEEELDWAEAAFDPKQG